MVRAALSRSFTLTEQEPSDAAVRFAGVCHLAGTQLLAAETLDDVGARLDALLEDPAYYGRIEDMLEALEQRRIPDVDRPRSLESLEEFGAKLTEFVSSGALQPFLRAMKMFEIALDTLPPTAAEVDIGEQLRRLRREGLYFLVDPSICPREKRVMLDALKFAALFFALLGVFLLRLDAEPWMQLALAQAAERSAFGIAKWVASRPGSEISTEIVPADARYKGAEGSAFEDRIADLRAARGDLAVYPPEAWED